MAVREVKVDTTDLIGNKVYYDGYEIGHVVGINNDTITCAIDSDVVAHRIRGGKTTLSLEVIDK